MCTYTCIQETALHMYTYKLKIHMCKDINNTYILYLNLHMHIKNDIHTHTSTHIHTNTHTQILLAMYAFVNTYP